MIAISPDEGASHPYSPDCPCEVCQDAIGNQAEPDPRADLAAMAEGAMSLANEALKLADSPGENKLACLIVALAALDEARLAADALKD